jgi:very-short-patch-repair endonuclease
MKRNTPEYVMDLAKILKKNQTFEEEILWELLRKNKLGGYK